MNPKEPNVVIEESEKILNSLLDIVEKQVNSELEQGNKSESKS